jgi:hypothetical protein
MRGQWIGTYRGTNTGRLILNVDERAACFQGVVYLFDNNPEFPNLAVSFRTQDKERNLKLLTLRVRPFDQATGDLLEWEGQMS